MPATGLHFGVGMLAKGLFPRRVSLTAFVISQFVIDAEVAYFMFVRHEYPPHRWAHTFLVGGLIGACTGLGVVIGGKALHAFARSRWRVPELNEAAPLPAVVGGLLGGLTHPALDGVMHDGITPLRPFSLANPFHHSVGLPVLHVGLVAMGLVSVPLLVRAVRRLRDVAKRDSE